MARWRGLPSDPGAVSTTRSGRRRRHPADGHLGQQPGGRAAHRRPHPDPAGGADAERRGRWTRAGLYGPGPRHAAGRHPDRPRLHRLLHERPDRGSARRRRRGQGPQGGRWRRRLGGPGHRAVKRQAEAEGLDRVFTAAGFEWREAGCSMCLGTNGESPRPASVSPRPRTAISWAARAPARARI